MLLFLSVILHSFFAMVHIAQDLWPNFSIYMYICLGVVSNSAEFLCTNVDLKAICRLTATDLDFGGLLSSKQPDQNSLRFHCFHRVHSTVLYDFSKVFREIDFN